MNFLKNIFLNPVSDFIYDVNSYVMSDEEHVKRNTIIQIVIATVAFILLVRVYPLGILQKHEYSKQQAFSVSKSDDLNGDAFTGSDKKLQTVYFFKEHIYQITLYLDCIISSDEENTQKIWFRIYDETFSCIYDEEYNCRKIAKDGYLKAQADMDVEPGKAYYYEIIVPEDTTAQIMLPVALRSELLQTENGTIYIDGIINDEVCLVADFDYSQPLSLFAIIFYYILIILAAIALYLLIMWAISYLDERFDENDLFIKKKIRLGISILAGMSGFVVFIYSVILNKFGSPVLDRVFYTIAIVVGMVWLMSAIWFSVYYPKAKKVSRLSVDRKMSLIWRNYIQVVSFGFLFYALCQYTNADREYYHYTNTRWMLIFLAIAFLMTYSEKYFLNKFSYVWGLVSAAGSVLYCNQFIEDEKELMLARLTCGVVVAWGLLIINMFLRFKNPFKKFVLQNYSLKDFLSEYFKNNWIQLIYVTAWIVFSVLMYCYRFEKIWVFTATLPFVAIFFLRITEASKSRLFKNLTNGIILSFGLVTVFCLMHRPHHYWMLYRYGGIFHTVACTGMYLAVVLAAAVSKLYGRLKKDTGMSAFVQNCGEYFIISCIMAFIILTMSRTAFLTSTVIIVMVTVLTAFTYKKSVARILKETGILVVAAVLSFPLVFTSVRMIPALVNDPVRYDVEFQDDSFMICKGDPVDSDKYMTVQRFFMALFGRFSSESEDEQAQSLSGSSDLLVYNGNNFYDIELCNISDDLNGAAVNETELSDKKDISNGRFDIFRGYLSALEVKGHPKMSPEDDGVQIYAHAHNSYLQVAYNFGIIAGAVFLIICALSLLSSIILFYKNGYKYSSYLLPFSLIVAFGFISLTEWAFHPCIPAGFSFLIIQVPLIRGSVKRL